MSALKSGMDRKTARKYLKHPERVGEPRPARAWRTRRDPLATIWREAEPRFSHLLTWAIPSEARPLIPKSYRRTFAADELEIYARQPAP